MTIVTKTLAIHSIQKNMLGIEQKNNELYVLLGNGKELIIRATDKNVATEIYNCLHYYPTEGVENNSKDFNDFFELDAKPY